jgi:phosphoserine phosphatase RsbU/P
VVIYYTDGFTDAANQHGDRFDEERLLHALQWACTHYDHPQEILEYLFNQVQQFIGSTHAQDDMTLIVMKVQSQK